MQVKNLKWNKIIFDWYDVLKDKLIDTDYIDRLMIFLNTEYRKRTIYPRKSDVFKAFELTSFKDLRVVIIGQDPYFNGEASGLAFGINDNCIKTPPSLEKINEVIELDQGMNINPDLSLETWASQGVLLLNTSLTVRKRDPASHSLQWNLFTKGVIKAISEEKTGIIFLLWGSHAKKYKKLINEKKHFILEAEHPAYAARQHRSWKCDHFKRVNEIIKGQNGKEFCIKW